MSPELASASDTGVDVLALGCVLYFMTRESRGTIAWASRHDGVDAHHYDTEPRPLTARRNTRAICARCSGHALQTREQRPSRPAERASGAAGLAGRA